MFFNRDKETYLRWIDYVLPAFFLISIIECYLGLWHLNLYVKLASILLTVLLIRTSQCSNNRIIRIVKIFVFYNIFTIIMYAFNGRPIILVRDELLNFIPSMLYVWIGASDNRIENRYYKMYFKYGAIVLGLGIICYVGNIGWYMNRMAEAMNSEWYINADIYDAHSVLDSLRFCGFFQSSYSVSHFSIFGSAIGVWILLLFKDRRIYSFVGLLIFLISALLCQQRIAMVVAIMYVLFYLYRSLQKNTFNGIRYILVGIIAVFISVSYFITNNSTRYETISTQLSNRFEVMSFNKAMEGSRNTKTQTAFNNLHNVITGEGLGSSSPIAARYHLSSLSDAGYIKILFESGIVGLLLFLYMMFITLRRCKIYFKYLIPETFIIVFILLAMIGSNSLTISYLTIIPFWYAVGRVWNQEYLNAVIAKEICV